MLAISVELLHGTYRADPDGTAATGRLVRGEWPPAPSRLFAAFVAADGTRGRLRVTGGSELEWFERLPPPLIHAHGRPWHQAQAARYVVRADRSFARVSRKGLPAQLPAHLEYIGRRGAEVRPGVRVTPRHPTVVYIWDTSCPPDTLDALRLRAARIGYLGTADSPVRIRVRERAPEPVVPDEAFRPHAEGNICIRVPEPGDLRLLDRVYDAWVERGAAVARAQFPALSHEAGYLSPGAAVRADRGGVAAWLRLGAPVPGRRVSVVTSLFKKAVLAAHQRLHGEPPPVLHGHGFRRRGYDLARFLALPDAGFPRSRGRIHGLALWLPPGCGAALAHRARLAARAVRRLYGGGVEVSVTPYAGETRPVAATPGRWTRPARSWITAFPAVHERRVSLDLAEVSRWCGHAGLPAPVAFRSSRSPLVAGGTDLAPAEVNRPGKSGLRYSHVRLWFAEPVEGPVVIGGARQRGLGLCVDHSRDRASGA